MGKFSNRYKTLNLSTVFVVIAMIIAGCASVQQPTGGPKDAEPPKVVRESPANLSKNFKAQKIEIELDEYFKISNESKEISISPAMDKLPEFRVKKKILEITFKDTLEKNTTYSINFGKGIVDYNEGNVLKNYSYVFATGDVIDSLSISGTVTNSLTNKPEIETTVFILPIKQDSLFGKKRANIFTSTDSSGNFTLKNLREDTYRIYALREQGGDRIFNSTNEAVAFQKEPIVLKRNVTDVKLTTFNEDPEIFRVTDRKLLSDGHLLYAFNQKLSTPELKVISPEAIDKAKRVEFNKTNDSVLVWFPEITFDSISVAIQDKGKPLDTVTIRRNKKDTYTTVVTVSDNVPSSKIRQKTDLILTLSSPITAADPGKIVLLEDSIPRPYKFSKDSTSFRKYRITYQWRNKRQYILQIADNAFTSISGGKNKASSRPFALDPEDNYTNLFLNVAPPDSSTYIVEVTSNEKVISSTIVKGKKKLDLMGLAPGKYNVRVVYDTNNNGIWDTGKVKEGRQPERIWNYEKEILLRVNLEDEENIVIPR